MTRDFYAHVRVGSCDIAVPVACIAEALDPQQASAATLPRRPGPGALAGVVEVRGGVVPLVALDRWVPMGEAAAAGQTRVVLLRTARSTVAIQVDALLGIRRIAASAIHTVCHDGAEDELFESVAPATGDRPLLCVLDVARLMKLAEVWCETAGLDPAAPELAAAALQAAADRSALVRHVVFTIGGQLWALPAQAVAKLAPTPPDELRLAGQRVCGIGTWDGRKLPFVDLGSARDGAGSSRPWMAVLVDGPRAIGLVVDRCETLVNVAADDIVPLPGDELRTGTVMLRSHGEASVLDPVRLFDAVPEAVISEARQATDRKTAKPVASPVGVAAPDTTAPSDYLVFEADRAYASPAGGLLGVVALSAAATDALSEGRRATVEWRGEMLGVVNLPRLDGRQAGFPSRLAVVVDIAGDGHRRSAIAVRHLTRWLPAKMAHRSTMRMQLVGDVSVVTPTGSQRSESLVVVDLPQMAYLLD